MSITYHTHIDTLNLSFPTIDSLNYHYSSSNNYKVMPITAKKDFRRSYDVYTTLNNTVIHFATIHHQYILTPTYSTIQLTNYALYQAGWSNILNYLIQDFRLDISIRKMEIAIDTNKNILKKLHTIYMNSDKLFIKDQRYDFDNYGKTKFVKNQGYKGYFNNTATQKLHNNKSSTNSQFDRIENKTNEIVESSNKHYIFKYLNDYLDVNTPIFRFEKTLFFEDLTYKNPIYLNTETGETLTKHLYNKLNNALKYDYVRSTEITKLDIDFSRLEDHDYLTSLFNHFALMNHEIIIDTFKDTPHFVKKYVKRYTIIKPKTRRLSIKDSKLDIQSLKAEYERINSLYTLPIDVSAEQIRQRELDILFNTPIPSDYISNNNDIDRCWLI